MATILEGLNKLSGALGGAETATENLEALNAIAGALGGETTATSNADAIDQIAEHASGGGGGLVQLTIGSAVSDAYINYVSENVDHGDRLNAINENASSGKILSVEKGTLVTLSGAGKWQIVSGADLEVVGIGLLLVGGPGRVNIVAL